MKQVEEFKVRSYGRQELAQLYSPHILPGSAWRKLKQWIMLNPVLRNALAPQGRLEKLRTFTPRQVELIIGQLGEP